ncbi:MAG: hypothetical protein ABIT58_10335, partial [Ferruginibacter sp.]
MENQDAGKVCAECLKETKISYNYKNNFFGPLYGDMNRVGEVDMGLFHNLFARFGEWLYRQYDKIRALFRALNKFLFPRKNIIWGQVEDSYLTGHLVHTSRYTPRSPVRHVKLEFWARTRFG